MEDYLVDTCGLTAAQALKASKNVSHLKSATKPDAVLAILSGVGLSGADLAAVFAAEPRLLCTKAPSVALRVASLRHRVGLSDPQIASLLLLPGGAKGFHTCDMAPRLEFWIPFLGSFEMLDLEEEQRDRQLEPREGYQAQHRAAPGVRAKVFVILSRCPRRPRGSSRSAQRD
jgi:mTERF domain-containing protein